MVERTSSLIHFDLMRDVAIHAQPGPLERPSSPLEVYFCIRTSKHESIPVLDDPLWKTEIFYNLTITLVLQFFLSNGIV